MTTLHIPDMSCGHCKASITAALMPLTSDIAVDMDARNVRLADSVDVAAAISALSDIGFPAEILAD